MHSRKFYTDTLRAFLHFAKYKEMNATCFVKGILNRVIMNRYYLNLQIHGRAVWLSHKSIYIMCGNNMDQVTFLKKFNSLYILSTNININEALLPAPIIFTGCGIWGVVFDLK